MWFFLWHKTIFLMSYFFSPNEILPIKRSSMALAVFFTLVCWQMLSYHHLTWITKHCENKFYFHVNFIRSFHILFFSFTYKLNLLEWNSNNQSLIFVDTTISKVSFFHLNWVNLIFTLNHFRGSLERCIQAKWTMLIYNTLKDYKGCV